MTLVYLLLAIIPSGLIGWYLYKKDFNKEPKGLLIGLFFGGVGSCFLTFILSAVLNSIVPGLIPTIDGSVNYNLIELFIKVMLGVALVEEFSKWFFAYVIGYKSKEFDEVYDILLYCGFVALGFATFENILYVFVSDNTMQTALLRAVTAVPGHVCDAVLMGYYLGLAKQYEVIGNRSTRKKYLILSIAIPMVSHGIYDFLVMSGSGLLVIVWLVFIVLMYIYVIKKIRDVSRERKVVYQPVSNMPLASIYFSQDNNYRPMYNTFGNNSMYANGNPNQPMTNNGQATNTQMMNSNQQMYNNQVANNNVPININTGINQAVNNTGQDYAVKYCPNCGKYEPDANFCSQCGSKIR